jgi:hypothetical protein
MTHPAATIHSPSVKCVERYCKMVDKTIEYHGVFIQVWEQSIRCSPDGSAPLWLKRPVEDPDIEAIKGAIDAGRAAMAKEIRELRQQEERLLGER